MDGSRSSHCNTWIDEFNVDTIRKDIHKFNMGDYMIEDLFRPCW